MTDSNIVNKYTEGLEFTPEKTEKALNVAFNILDKWSFNDAEKRATLGLSDTVSLDDKSVIAEASDIKLQFRLSIIIGLYADLKILSSSHEPMIAWLQRPLPNGKVPIDVLMSDNYPEMLNLRRTAKSLR
ncbi:MAG: hypothetical protein CMF12_13500 [Idiomarina sp.]|jgi:hypothetical protein|uniref:hypothetical protein n=1 Tax=Idiomarina sp. TaxID=1874361 RepID=UPI000C554395|nr:hypothetical protein [Idiomarina sp.]MBT43522.1 hypothetical protein [Idiomarina sp.]